MNKKELSEGSSAGIALIALSLFLFISFFLYPVSASQKSLDNLSIPSKFGYISKISVQEKEPARTVIYIQDLHADYTAQKNIAAILEALIKEEGIKVVLVEGGSGDDSLAYMRDYAPPDKVKEVAEEYLKNGDISGEEYLSLVSNEDFRILGIENPALYDNHMRSFLEISSIKEKSVALVDEFVRLADALKDRAYSAKIKEFEQNRKNFDTGALTLVAYLAKLEQELKANKIDYSRAPQFTEALRLVALEQSLDLDKVETERATLIQELVKAAPGQRTEALTKKANEFKADKISASKFYAFLKGAAIENKIDLEAYPNLFKYLAYMEIADRLNHELLFNEIEGVRDELRERIFVSDEERRLYKIAKDASVLKQLIETSLRPAEYEYFKREKAAFDMNGWSIFLNGLAAQYNLSQRITSNFSIVQDNLYTFENYYVLAKARDAALAQNIERRMKEEGADAAVVIAGGFHADALLDLLKEQGFSYALVSPNIGNDPNTKKLYVEKLVEKWNPGEWAIKE